MKKLSLIILFVYSLYILSGCQSASATITEEEAEAIVIEKNTGDIGEVEIISINHKRGKYIIEWKKKKTVRVVLTILMTKVVTI